MRLLAGVLLLAGPAWAQVPATEPPAVEAAGAATPVFDCVGAEQLEDDAFAIPFARGEARLGPAAAAPLAAVLALAGREPERRLCVLGHAGRQEGGAATQARLAAARAAAVAEALAARGVAQEALRAEIRVASFARAANLPGGARVTVVFLPQP